MNKGAILSEDNKYRYKLWREWNSAAPKVAIVGLNPSVADHEIDDPTITRCIDFVKSWGYGGFYMVNLFAFRTTNPIELSEQTDPVGPDNDKHLKEVFKNVDKVVCAWGNGGTLKARNIEVLQLIDTPYCLQRNSSGEPAHPLYLKKSLQPILLFEPTSKFQNSGNELEKQQNEANPFESNPSKHIFRRYHPTRQEIKYVHRLKHFGEEENLQLSLKITDGEAIFNQSDELIIGKRTIYWYMSRVGVFYSKSNGAFDATHKGDELVLSFADVIVWKAVFIRDTCYLEMETTNQDRYISVSLPITEQEQIVNLQKELNALTNASR